MLVVKILASLLGIVVMLCTFPAAVLIGAVVIAVLLSDIEQSVAAGVAKGLAQRCGAPTAPPSVVHVQPLPRLGYTSQEDYVNYRQAHGLPYTKATSMWSDGS